MSMPLSMSAAAPRLAYFFSTFPALTTTFMNRQVAATRRLGLPTLLVANRTPDRCGYHPQDQYLYDRTLYLVREDPGAYLKSALRWFRGDPQHAAAAVRLALALKDGFPRQRWRRLIHLIVAARLNQRLTDAGAVCLHVHFAYGAASVALFLNALTGIPYSVSIHGGDALLDQPLIEQKLLRAQFVVSNCQFHIQNLRRRFPALRRQRFYVVPGGVDLFRPPYARVRPPSGGGPLKLLCVGRLVWEKAHPILIRALYRLRQEGQMTTCRLVGDGPERKRIERLIRELKLEDCVTLCGALDQQAVASAYEWADVLVLPSVSEGTPMVVIEAMSKGRPIIASRITALSEMIADGETGLLVSPNSPTRLARAIRELAADPAKRAALGAAGRKRAEALFDLNTNARRLMAVFAYEYPRLGLDRNHYAPPQPQ